MDNLNQVRESGMCIGCGACSAADNTIKLKIDNYYEIYSPNKSSAIGSSVCPSLNVDYLKLHNFKFHDNRNKIDPYGKIDSLMLAQSTNFKRNFKSSSGGMIKEISKFLIDNNIIDAIISIKHKEGIEYEPTVISKSEEIDSLPASIYHNLNLENAIKILKKENKRFALIAIPCQLEGIYNYISKINPNLKGKIKISIGLLCAWQYTRHSIYSMAKLNNIKSNEIKNVSYRGDGMIGKFKIFLKNKILKINRRSNLNYQISFDRFYNTPRCNVCVNHLNILADIVVGDSWMQSTRFTKTGISILLTRTKSASSIIQRMQRKKLVNTYKIPKKGLDESEGIDLIKGRFAHAYMRFLQKNNINCPKFTGFRPENKIFYSAKKISTLHEKLLKRRKMLGNKQYCKIKYMKLYQDGFFIIKRYIKWFINRVFKLKKITGKDASFNAQKIKSIFK